ncbi:MAG: RHS repeat-associated core domain-containing protein [Pseudomonadota bacterium]
MNSYYGPCDTLPSTAGPSGTYLEGGYDANAFSVQVTGGATPQSGTVPQPGNTTSEPGKSAIVGDPINAQTRSLYSEFPLFDLGGPFPVNFQLAYQSYAASGETGFFQAIPRISRKSTDSLSVTGWGDGLDTLAFEKDTTGQWQNSATAIYRYGLQETAGAGGWFYLMDPSDQTVYIFEKNSLADDDTNQVARLRYQLDRNGNQISHTYSCWDCAPGTTIISDGLGRQITLSVSAGGYLTSVSDGSRSYSLGYNASGQLINIFDPKGGMTLFEYSTTSGSLTKQTYPIGNSPFTQVYESPDNGQVQTQTDAFGNTTALSTKSSAGQAGDQVVETRPDGTQVVYQHATQGSSPVSIQYPDGNTATFTVNTKDQIVGITDRMGDSTAVTFHDETGFQASLTNAMGHTLSHTYLPQNQSFSNPGGGQDFSFTFYNLSRTDYPDGSFETFDYDANGNLAAHTDRQGQTTSFLCNAKGQILTITNAAGGKQTFSYNSDGTMAGSSDSDIGDIAYSYDSLKRLVTIAGPGPGQITITYDSMDQITAVMDENGHSFQYAYDANGNLIQVTDALGNTTQYAYDLMDRINQVTDRSGNAAFLARNFRGQVTQSTDANKNQTDFAFDTRGWVTGMIRNGKTYSITRDDEGIPTGYITPAGLLFQEQTDKLGFLTSITLPGGETAQIDRDPMSRIIGITDPSGYQTLYGYDAEDRLCNVTLPDGNSVTYGRNVLGNLSSITDLNGQNWQFSHTAMGRLMSWTDPLSRTVSYTLDTAGRPKTADFFDGTTETRSYDNAGNMIQRVYSDGTNLSYTYDDMDNLTSTDNLSLTRDNEERVIGTTFSGQTFGTTYDAGGRTVTATYPGFTVSYTYNEDDLLSGVSDSFGNQINFIYDGDGRLTSLNRSNGINAAMLWNVDGRMSNLQDGGLISLQYTYDALGRMLAADGTWPLEITPHMKGLSPLNFSVDAASQITSSGYAYDNRGRTVSLPGHSLTWDAAERLIGIDSIGLGYNGLGEIISRTENGTSTFFFHNHGLSLNPLVAEQQNGQFTRFYVYTPCGRLLYSISPQDGNAVHFYHYDHMGSTLALSNGSGSFTDRYVYSPYGELLSHTGGSDQPFTYVGMLGVRQEGDLFQMRLRYYDPTTARFLSREPVWPLITNPKFLNPYQYAAQSPLLFVDPLGTVADIVIEWGILILDALDPKNHTEGVVMGTWGDYIWNTANYREMYDLYQDMAQRKVEREGKIILERQQKAYKRRLRMHGYRNLQNKPMVKRARQMNQVKRIIRQSKPASDAGRKLAEIAEGTEITYKKGSIQDQLNQRTKMYNKIFQGDFTDVDQRSENQETSPSRSFDNSPGTPAQEPSIIDKIKQRTKMYNKIFQNSGYE